MAPKFTDYTEFDDGLLWNASLVLLNYLKDTLGEQLKGKKILELGSGLGHLGLGLSDLGADVTLTEHPMVLDSLVERVNTYNESHKIKARAIELEWGEEGWNRSPASSENIQYDIIISAELLGVVDFHDSLLWTIQKLSHPSVAIYSVFCDRPFSYMFFAKLADTHMFRVQPLAVTSPAAARDGHDDDAGINLHLITRL